MEFEPNSHRFFTYVVVLIKNLLLRRVKFGIWLSKSPDKFEISRCELSVVIPLSAEDKDAWSPFQLKFSVLADSNLESKSVQIQIFITGINHRIWDTNCLSSFYHNWQKYVLCIFEVVLLAKVRALGHLGWKRTGTPPELKQFSFWIHRWKTTSAGSSSCLSFWRVKQSDSRQ